METHVNSLHHMTMLSLPSSHPHSGFGHRRIRRLARVVALVMVLLINCVAVEARRLNTISNISVSLDADGSTVVRISGSIPFPEKSYRSYQIEQSPPRAVLRLSGIQGPYETREIQVDDGNVVRINVSHNPSVDPPELSLVLQLDSHDVRIQDITPDGRQLHLRLAGGNAAPPPLPTPTPQPRATSTPSETPLVAVETPTAQPTPSATRTPTRRPTPTPVPAPRPPVGRSTDAAGPKLLYRAPAPSAAEQPGSARLVPETVVTTIAEIVASRRSNGATLLRITLADPIGERRLRHRRDPMDPLRLELVIQGVEMASAPSAITANLANLVGLQLSQLPEVRVPELKIALLLSSEQIGIERVALQGSHVVVLLDPPPPP